MHASEDRPSAEFTGTAYDIDYSPNRTQVLIKNANATHDPKNLTGFITSDLLQNVLQASLIAARIVRVTHFDGNIIRAVLVPTPTICSDDGCITEVDCTATECTAVIVGEPGRLNIKDQRTLGVFLTAINDDRRVQNLSVDQSRNIIQVKVNVP